MRRSSNPSNLFSACLLGIALTAARNAAATRATFVYVNANPDNESNSIAALHIGADGQTNSVSGSPFATGGVGLAPVSGAEFAHRIVVAPSRNLLFAANDGSGSISAFAVDPLSGVLEATPGSPFTFQRWSGFSGISLALSNDGRFLYASGATLLGFAVAADGTLTQLGSEWSFGQRIGGIGVTGDNSQVFVSTANGVFILSSGDAGLTADPPSFLSIGSQATDLRLDALGPRLWVGTKNGGILAYTQSGGVATVAPGAPFFSAVSGLSGLSADYYGRTLFAFSAAPARLLGAHTNADASLTLSATSPVVPTLPPTSAALTPDGSLLVVTDAQSELDAWTTDDSGSLTHAGGYPLATNATPGFPSVATFPDKAPTPAPASPAWLAFVLGAALLLAGTARTTAEPRLPARD